MQRSVALLLATLVVATPALARKDCEELKREIAARIDANGVKAYTLEVIAADTATSARIVGSCDGGTRRIAYARPGAAAASPEIVAAPVN